MSADDQLYSAWDYYRAVLRAGRYTIVGLVLAGPLDFLTEQNNSAKIFSQNNIGTLNAFPGKRKASKRTNERPNE